LANSGGWKRHSTILGNSTFGSQSSGLWIRHIRQWIPCTGTAVHSGFSMCTLNFNIGRMSFWTAITAIRNDNKENRVKMAWIDIKELHSC
jgi:hypothetical protein